MNNTIIIEVGYSNEPSAECIPVGGCGEHNAAILKFVLDAVFTYEYKYYLEFTLPNAKSFRTDYLELNSTDNSILFSVPASLSSESCVDCCFNAVKIDADGKTIQLLKPKSLTMIFSPLYNANGEILKEYDFSVNTLLEKIKSGAFKGDKGEQGDSYNLTLQDIEKISEKISERIYGLPLNKKASSVGNITLSDAADSKAVSFCIYGESKVLKPDESTDISKDNISELSGLTACDITVNDELYSCNFQQPLNKLQEYADKTDLSSGKTTTIIGTYKLNGSETIYDSAEFVYNDKPYYRYYFSPKPNMKTGTNLPGFCSHFEEVFSFIPNQLILNSIINSGKRFRGVWFGQTNNVIYFFSEMNSTQLKAFFKEQYDNQTPVTLYYVMQKPVETDTEIKDIMLKNQSNIQVSPVGLNFDIEYNADISKVIENIESKLPK